MFAKEMGKLKITLRSVGRILLIAFFVLPTYPDAITGSDSVSSWTPGCALFIMEPLRIMMKVSNAAYFAQEVEANPDDYRGDGLVVYNRGVAWSVVQHAFIFGGSILMVACALWRWKRWAWRLGAAALMLIAMTFFIQHFMVGSQTYVDGAHHIGIGSYFWVLSCLTFVASLLIDSESDNRGCFKRVC